MSEAKQSDLTKLVCCPLCYGGYTFHSTYGTESKCRYCKGKGKIKRKTLVELGIEDFAKTT